MISDAGPWRDELLAAATRLEKRKDQRRWTERTSFLVERDIMMGAYTIRRLKESFKISDAVSLHETTVDRYQLTGPMPDVYNRHEIWKSFDLEASIQIQLNIGALCNQIIHSWVWLISAPENGLGCDGIYVSSDRMRKKYLYFISLDSLIGLYRKIGAEDITSISMRRDGNGEMHIVQIIGTPIEL